MQKINTSDNQLTEIDREMFQKFSQVFQELEYTQNDQEPIQLMINSDIINKLKELLKLQKQDNKDQIQGQGGKQRNVKILTKANVDFLKKCNLTEIQQLLLASQYLKIGQLEQLLTKYMESLVITIKADQKVCKIDQEAFVKFSKMFENYNPKSKEKYQVTVKPQLVEAINEQLKFWKQNPPYEIPKPIPSGKLQDFVYKEDYEFVKSQNIQELLEAAQIFGIEHLENLCYAAISANLLQYTTNELIKKYEIDVTYTQQLEEKIKSQYEQYFKIFQ